jgi:hypothetical protein
MGKWPSALGTVVVMEAKYIPFLLFKVRPDVSSRSVQ